METVTDVCRNIVENTQEALACGVVDVNTGMFMGVHHIVPYFTQDYLDVLAAATVEIFRGRTFKRVEELMSSLRGTPVQDSFEEIFISSSRVFHFMKLISEKQVITVLVTRKSVSQGMGWASLRTSVSDLLAALP
jgi:hypothetical protein